MIIFGNPNREFSNHLAFGFQFALTLVMRLVLSSSPQHEK